jgi:hypothetical protein
VRIARAEPIKKHHDHRRFIPRAGRRSLYRIDEAPFWYCERACRGFFPRRSCGATGDHFPIRLRGRSQKRGQERSRTERLTWKKLLLTVGSLLVFAVVFERLGYLVATFLFIIFLLRAVEQKSWALAIAVGLSASVGSYLIFGILLGAPLPAGFLQI